MSKGKERRTYDEVTITLVNAEGHVITMERAPDGKFYLVLSAPFELGPVELSVMASWRHSVLAADHSEDEVVPF